MEESLILLKEKFHLKETDANQYSPLVLAYLGDAVYEILIRTIVVSEGNMQVNKLHKKSSALVKAAAQAEFLMAIEEDLTEEEHAVYKRGRNAKSFSMAKNATMKDYRMATGFEALMGYLYLSGKTERMVDLVALAMKKTGKAAPEALQDAGVKRTALAHNKKKRYLLEEGRPVPFLVDLGVMTPEGKIVHARYDKFRQINRFLEFVEDIAERPGTDDSRFRLR